MTTAVLFPALSRWRDGSDVVPSIPEALPPLADWFCSLIASESVSEDVENTGLLRSLVER